MTAVAATSAAPVADHPPDRRTVLGAASRRLVPGPQDDLPELRDRLVGVCQVGQDLPHLRHRVNLDPAVCDIRGVPVTRVT